MLCSLFTLIYREYRGKPIFPLDKKELQPLMKPPPIPDRSQATNVYSGEQKLAVDLHAGQA